MFDNILQQVFERFLDIQKKISSLLPCKYMKTKGVDTFWGQTSLVQGYFI